MNNLYTLGVDKLSQKQNLNFQFEGENIIEKRVKKEKYAVNNYIQQIQTLDLEIVENKSYFERICELADLINPLDSECRLSVCVPVHNEERNITNFLNNFLNSEHVETNQFEINILINGIKDYRKDRTAELIHEFQTNNPQIRINLLEVELQKQIHTIGLIRKILADITLLRLSRRNSSKPLYLQSEDADVKYIKKDFIYKVISTFDQNLNIDCLTGTHDRKNEIKNDLVYIFSRMLTLTERYFLRKMQRYSQEFTENGVFKLSKPQEWCRLVTTGWNTFFSAEILASIGGYEHTKTYGEDLDIGDKISIFRGTNTEGGLKINTDTIKHIPIKAESSNRRFATLLRDYLSLGKSGNPYSDFGSEGIESRVREVDLIYNDPNLSKYQDFQSLSEKEIKPLLEAILEYLLEFVNKISNKDQLFKEKFVSFMSVYAFSDINALKLENEKIKIISIEKLLSKLN